jgi:methyltransferase-like protein 6
MAAGEQQPQLGATRVSSSSSAGSGRLVTPFWKGSPRNSTTLSSAARTASSPCLHAVSPTAAEKYERDARRYWDIFYKRHEDKVSLLTVLRTYILP